MPTQQRPGANAPPSETMTLIRPLSKLIAAALLAFSGATALAAAQETPFAPAVVVDEAVITHFDIRQRANVLIFLGSNPAVAEETAEEQLVTEALMVQGAGRLGIEVTEDIVTEGLRRFAASNNAEPSQVLAQASAAGVDIDSLRMLFGTQIAWQEAMRRRFAGRARPSERDIDAAILLLATEPAREVNLAEIAIPIFERGEAGTETFLQQLYAELNGGRPFEEAAREYSRSASAASGGALGWNLVSALPTDMARVIDGVPPGDLTPPLSITNGVSVLKIIDERPGPPSAADRVTVEYILARFPDRATARAARTSATSCSEMQSRALPGALGAAEAVGPITLAETDPALFDPLSQGALDIVSQPVAYENAFALLLLCDREVDASPEERRAVADQLFAERVTGYADGLLADLRRQALIIRR